MQVEQSDMYVNHMHHLSGKNVKQVHAIGYWSSQKHYDVEWFFVLNVHKFCLKLTNIE